MNVLDQKEAVLPQLNRLYIGSRKKYMQQFSNGQYAQIKRTLTDKQVTAHLKGEQTIGVFYCGQRSKFLSFDVDTTDWMTVNALITALHTAGIPSDAVHTEFSGMKGYHITVFFDRVISIRRLASFGRSVIDKLGEHGKKIELRPESVNGRGIKLPFALHHGSGQRSCFVDPFTLQPYSDQASYLLQIQPFSADTMEQIITETIRRPLEREPPRPVEEALEEARRLFKNIRPPTVQNSLSSKAERLLTEGMRDGEERHKSQFYVILFLKAQGWTQEEVTQQTIEWALREKANGRAESSEEHIRRDITKNVMQLFDSDRELYDSRPFTTREEDLAFASSFKRTTVKKTVWALVILSRIFADDEGRFYAGRRMLEDMTGMGAATIVKNLSQLMDDGVLEKVKDGSYAKRRAAQYRLHGISDGQEGGTTFECGSYRELFDRTYQLVKDYVHDDGRRGCVSTL